MSVVALITFFIDEAPVAVVLLSSARVSLRLLSLVLVVTDRASAVIRRAIVFIERI